LKTLGVKKYTSSIISQVTRLDGPDDIDWPVAVNTNEFPYWKFEFAKCEFSAVLCPRFENLKAEVGIGFKVWFRVSVDDSIAPVLYPYIVFSLTTQGLLKSKEISVFISGDCRLD
jgi:hypothetical protein